MLIKINMLMILSLLSAWLELFSWVKAPSGGGGADGQLAPFASDDKSCGTYRELLRVSL